MSAYLFALKEAALAGHYVPEIEIVYLREDDFHTPRACALNFGH